MTYGVRRCFEHGGIRVGHGDWMADDPQRRQIVACVTHIHYVPQRNAVLLGYATQRAAFAHAFFGETDESANRKVKAALAAGLIDPSRIEIEGPSAPGLNPSAEHWLTLRGPGVSMQNPPVGLDSGRPPVTASADRSTDSAAANPAKTIEAISTMAMTKPVPPSSRQSAATAPDGMTPTAPRRQTVQMRETNP